MKISKNQIVIYLILVSILCLVFPPFCQASLEKFGHYIYDTVQGAVTDGVQLDIPKKLGNTKLANLGLVDVTAAPFFADSSGSKDSTKAIQEAINFARDNQMVCFFPSGIYLVSDTISCIQNYYQRSNNKITGARNFPCYLLGSSKEKRPQIILAPNSPGFQDPLHPKKIFHFWARSLKDPQKSQPNICWNQMLVNLDIKVSPGNKGAIGIGHQGAQGSGIQDCTIDIGDGFCGIEGGCGSGGSYVNITIIGGEIGMNLRNTQPSPTISAISLFYQKKHAIIYGGRQSLSAVGIEIISSGEGPAVLGVSEGSLYRGQISLVDSRINFQNGGGIAISSDQNIYLRNVYIKNAKIAVTEFSIPLLRGAGAGWLQVQEFAHSSQNKKFTKKKSVVYPIYINGIKIDDDFIKTKKNVPPPDDLIRQHTWLDILPDFESANVVNVKDAPYSAKGDGISDDWAAIQKAINEHEIVLIPKGYYNLTRSIILRPKTKLLGVASHLSVLMARPSSLSAFMDPQHPKPLVETADTDEAQTVIAQVGLYAPKITTGVFPLSWQSGGDSILRNASFLSQPPLEGFRKPVKNVVRDFAFVLVQNKGGGRWWNFFQEDHYKEGTKYRHLLIKGINGPFNIYQCAPEAARGDANMEIRNSTKVNIFGLKGEGNQPILMLKKSKDINVFGYGGNATASPGDALFVVDSSSSFRLVNIIESPRRAGKGNSKMPAGYAYPPNEWQMIGYDSKSSKLHQLTAPFERPVLYLRNY